MDRIYKIILVYELTLIIVLMLGYAIYDNEFRKENPQIRCGIEPIPNFSEINVSQEVNQEISISIGKKEDLNS